MTSKQAVAMKPGDLVVHSRYGKSTVKEVLMVMGSLFGIVILPSTEEGQSALSRDSGLPKSTPFLEDSPRRLSLA